MARERAQRVSSSVRQAHRSAAWPKTLVPCTPPLSKEHPRLATTPRSYVPSQPRPIGISWNAGHGAKHPDGRGVDSTPDIVPRSETPEDQRPSTFSAAISSPFLRNTSTTSVVVSWASPLPLAMRKKSSAKVSCSASWKRGTCKPGTLPRCSNHPEPCNQGSMREGGIKMSRTKVAIAICEGTPSRARNRTSVLKLSVEAVVRLCVLRLLGDSRMRQLRAETPGGERRGARETRCNTQSTFLAIAKATAPAPPVFEDTCTHPSKMMLRGKPKIPRPAASQNGAGCLRASARTTHVFASQVRLLFKHCDAESRTTPQSAKACQQNTRGLPTSASPNCNCKQRVGTPARATRSDHLIESLGQRGRGKERGCAMHHIFQRLGVVVGWSLHPRGKRTPSEASTAGKTASLEIDPRAATLQDGARETTPRMGAMRGCALSMRSEGVEPSQPLRE